MAVQKRVIAAGAGGVWRSAGVYPLVLAALLTVAAAALIIVSGLGRMQKASAEIAHRTKVAETSEKILSIAKDSETGQRGFLLTGDRNYLQPYREALQTAPSAWATFDAMELDPPQRVLRSKIRSTFDAKFAHNAQTISHYDGGRHQEAMAAVESGVGKRIMDRMRLYVTRFQAHEAQGLAQAEKRAASAQRLATILTLVSAVAFFASGAMMYAAMRRARADAGRQADLASTADQRFKATFEQTGIGLMHIDSDGRPILVNDAMCDMTGYSREDFVTATPESPAWPANLFSNKDRCEALLGGEVRSYRHEKLTQTKDGQEIYLSSLVSSVRDDAGNILFLSAVISDQTNRHRAEKELHDSQERLRRLQDEFAHVARVNDMGEMAAAIAHEVNQPLTAINNYMSVANKLVSRLDVPSDLNEVLQRASEQALRAGQIIKRMRGFVERTDEVRQVERVAPLIGSAIELAMIGTDRSKIDVVTSGPAATVSVRVDPIQFQQVLIILMRNAMEAFSAANCPGKCRIDLSTSVDTDAQSVVIDVSDNGPGLPADAAAEAFKPFVTSKPGNMGMGLSIAKRLIDSHGGRLTVQEPSGVGATFRITIPLMTEKIDQAA